MLAEFEDEREAAALAQRLPPRSRRRSAASSLTAAIGIAVEDPDRGATDLVQGADAAMQRVKARGGGAFEVFDRAMGGRLRDRLQIEDGLRRALERDELRLHYQPIVDLERAATSRVEALVRWQHPEEGLLAPGRFLPVAEQDGRLISAIGDWVLRQACIEVGALARRTCASASTSPRASSARRASWSGSRHDRRRRRRARADRAGDHRDDADGGRRGGDRRPRAARARTACRSTSTTSAPATRRSRGSRGCR